jgi:hypothetical protein
MRRAEPTEEEEREWCAVPDQCHLPPSFIAIIFGAPNFEVPLMILCDIVLKAPM